MEILSSISGIVVDYDAFFLDLWGVVHDGSQLYPGVLKTIEKIKKSGKRIVFISNAPRRAERVISVLNELGIEKHLYDHVVSSGEVGFHWLEQGCKWGKRYYMIAAEKDAGLLDNLDYVQVYELKDADFILNLGFGTDEQTTEDFASVLSSAYNLSLPMLCLNPDLEVVKITGERYPCAGAIAKRYVALGGEVKWFGKPYPSIYEHAYKLLGDVNKKHVLAVGDSLETDIPGAKNFGIDSVLVSGGILKDKNIAEIQEDCAVLGLNPNYLLPEFGI